MFFICFFVLHIGERIAISGFEYLDCGGLALGSSRTSTQSLTL